QYNGNQLESSCKAGTYCVCSDNKSYIAASGTNPCPYTVLPNQLYTPICPSSSKPPATKPPAIPSTISKAPPAPSPTTQNSPPPSPTRYVIIVSNNYIDAASRGPVIPLQVWKVWDSLKTDQFDSCGTGYVYRGVDVGDKQDLVNKNDQFPIEISPFDIAGHTNCAYKGNDHNSVGQLSCTGPGPWTTSCKAMPQDKQTPIDCSGTLFGGAAENGESARIAKSLHSLPYILESQSCSLGGDPFGDLFPRHPTTFTRAARLQSGAHPISDCGGGCSASSWRRRRATSAHSFSGTGAGEKNLHNKASVQSGARKDLSKFEEMGSSVKKKRDKKKDFQIPVLHQEVLPISYRSSERISNYAIAIVVSTQSLNINAPSSSDQFSHHVALLASRSDSQRKESLSYLTAAIVSRPVDSPLQQPVSILVPKLLPLILDGSNGVRSQLLKLLRVLPSGEVEDIIEKVLLYVRAGMTHLAADIRSSSMDILGWLLEVAGEALVSCAGGWVKTLTCFLAMLGWSSKETNESWSTNKASFGKAGGDGKILVKILSTLGVFLKIGLTEPEDMENLQAASFFPLSHVQYHMLPRRSNPYAPLNLFGPPRDEDNQMYEQCEERRKVLSSKFVKALEKGLESARQEGGEIGRAAAGVTKTMSQNRNDLEVDER
ncbi:Testis-expressed sequence 10 protein, partial [Xylographa trunciseda]|nr:Testis-expressed sequence 10 protein [Xylographa trunciseda]